MEVSQGSNFLIKLPLEIRMQIYREVLSPTGYIAVTSSQPDSISLRRFRVFSIQFNDKYCSHLPIYLSFLRTTKQVHREAKYIFFAHNILNTEVSGRARRFGHHGPGRLANGMDWCFLNLPDSLKLRVQNIHLDLELNIQSPVEAPDIMEPPDSMIPYIHNRNRMNAIFHAMMTLVNDGSLKLVQLNVNFKGMGMVEGLKALVNIQKQSSETDERQLFDDYLNFLRAARSGPLKDLKRRLFFHFSDITDWKSKEMEVPEGFCPVNGNVEAASNGDDLLCLFDKDRNEAKFYFGDVFREDDEDPNVVLEELHQSFGGELYVGSRLCYQSGIEQSRPWLKVSAIWPNHEQ
ncbi:hypothetical protein B0O99DRAFT_685182 [Bisporella sp. PMI_857]|nr:hypothetical protein B0O99DRAFT_685182 [Bisporella sp. PMI_857]